MKLLKLPILIQIEVYKNLQPCEYFQMSLCSLKSKQAIRTVKYYNAEVWISQLCRSLTFSIRYRDYQKDICFISLNTPMIPNLSMFQLKHAGNILKSSVESNNNGPCRIHLDTSTSLTIFYQYICHLFGVSSTDVYAEIMDKLDERCDEMKSLQIKRSRIFCHCPHWRDVEDFCLENPNHTYFNVTGRVRFSMLMSEDPYNSMKFMEIPNITIGSVRDHYPRYLMHFKGEHGYFENCRMSGYWMNKFLKDWIKRKEDELKSMIFVAKTDVEYDLNVAVCFDGLVTRKCNLAERSVFPYQSIISKYHKVPNEFFDCHNGTEITRDTDGKTMTIVISKQHVGFFVWP